MLTYTAPRTCKEVSEILYSGWRGEFLVRYSNGTCASHSPVELLEEQGLERYNELAALASFNIGEWIEA